MKAVLGYYPTILGRVGRDGAPSEYIVRSWLERLRVFPLAVVLGAVRRIHENSESQFSPRLPAVLRECESIHAYQSGQKGLGRTPRQAVREALEARTGALVKGRKGGTWRIARDGLAEVGGSGRTIPVANIPTQDLQWMVARVEPLVSRPLADLKRILPPPGEAQEGPQPARQEDPEGAWVEEIVYKTLRAPGVYQRPAISDPDEPPF